MTQRNCTIEEYYPGDVARTAVLQVAVPHPLRQTFDYLPPLDAVAETIVPGVRVRVPFGRRTSIGIVVSVSSSSRIDRTRLKKALSVLDNRPVLDRNLLELGLWASQYYQHPLGEVYAAMLPAVLRRGQQRGRSAESHWRITSAGAAVDPGTLTRAPRQAALLQQLRENAEGLGTSELQRAGRTWRSALGALIKKGWVEEGARRHSEAPPSRRSHVHTLSSAQQAATDVAIAAIGTFSTILLDGVTGSGKTEVYLRVIDEVNKHGHQVLVLVPEIALTPQTLERFRRHIRGHVALLHSGLSDVERLNAWLDAATGRARVVLGTRSAVFTPFHRLGLIVIDEEHDTSFKQQDGFLYHARDVAIMRAHMAAIPVILGSATPSLESLHNADRGRYTRMELPERTAGAQRPEIELVDVRGHKLEHGLCSSLRQRMEQHLNDEQQVLLFLNRRGYAPVLLCHDCGWVARCSRCDANLTVHINNSLQCHHCGAQQRRPPRCDNCKSGELRDIGHGTERIEEGLRELFPDVDIVRVDRDTTRRRGAIERLVASVRRGKRQILVGTQILAKGHHFPNVTLVGVLNVDQGLFSADFRAPERMAQLIVQVSGRAGRGNRSGTVLIQTHHPDHPLLRALVEKGYTAFARLALDERRAAGLPPFSAMALLRAESVDPRMPYAFLDQARVEADAATLEGCRLLGPVPAPMERRAGRHRAHLLIESLGRANLHHMLHAWIPKLESLKDARKVRWSIDVDPVELL